MRRETRCKVCDDVPVVGHFGCCRACADAVSRFIALRRANLRARRTK